MSDKELIESESSEEENIEEWEELKEHPDYEICVNYPHQIRKRCNGRILKESNANGYLQVYLNGKPYLKHRLIAIQFISNPKNLPQVDHINHVRNDNGIENLRWVSQIQNSNNKSKASNSGRRIEYVQELPDDVIVVNQYHQYHFEGYYFSNDVFYKDTGNGDFRIVPWHKIKDRPNSWNISLTDTNTIRRTISKGAFYHIYGLE